MFLSISRELGEETEKRVRKSRAKKNWTLRNLLLRLHARSCQVTAEIITLVENGYADGAMARWRTLHEICVVATVISDSGEDLAERYVDHEIIESKRALDEYMICHKLLGYKPISKRETAHVNQAYDAAIEKYGKDFGAPYGWASAHLKKKRPAFRDLESRADQSFMRSQYKMASYNVHAGSKSMFFRLSMLSEQSHVLAGASNAGLDEPGQNTAYTLAMIDGVLCHERMNNLNVQIQIRTILLLRDQIVRAFVSADRKLRQDEASLARK
jgi:hypothetical protein